jgi:hypothetical protein
MLFDEILENLGEQPKDTPTIVTDRVWNILVDWNDEMICYNNYILHIGAPTGTARRIRRITSNTNAISIRIYEVASNGNDAIHLTTTIVHKSDIGTGELPDAVSALLRRHWNALYTNTDTQSHLKYWKPYIPNH